VIRTVLLFVLLASTALPVAALKPDWSTDVFFTVNSDVMEQGDVQRLASALPIVPSKFLCDSGVWVVVGHADPTEGSPKQTADLSNRRAHAVAASMRMTGIADQDIYVAFKGASAPVAKPPHRHNRRVEIEYAPCEKPRH
jgi:outer membrane protein OmpA-like peptidoglycan-associated protein